MTILLYITLCIIDLFFLSLSISNIKDIINKPKENTNKTNLEIQKMELEKLKMNYDVKITEDIYSILDLFIADCMKDYLILNPKYSTMTYIDNNTETQICKEVGQMVIKNISNTILTKISLIYNIDEIETIISVRVYIFVMNYVIDYNDVKK